jgi:hypothetical protein
MRGRPFLKKGPPPHPLPKNFHSLSAEYVNYHDE